MGGRHGTVPIGCASKLGLLAPPTGKSAACHVSLEQMPQMSPAVALSHKHEPPPRSSWLGPGPLCAYCRPFIASIRRVLPATTDKKAATWPPKKTILYFINDIRHKRAREKAPLPPQTERNAIARRNRQTTNPTQQICCTHVLELGILSKVSLYCLAD